MTLLSRKADYALLILSHLHQRPEGATARAIADTFELSRAFVANILKELCNKRFVVSHRGVKGGYSLTRDAAGINLADLLESIEEGFHLTACSDTTDHDACSHATLCTVKGPMATVHARLIDVLRGVTLAELFGPRHDPRPSTLTALPMLGSVVETSKV